MEGCVQPEVETGEPQNYGRWKGSQRVTRHSISMKVGWHQMKLAQGRFTTKSSSSHQCELSCKITCQRTQAGNLHSSQKKPLGKKPIKYRSSPLLQNLSPRHWKLGICYQTSFCAYLCFIFPGASAVGHCQKQEPGQSRPLVIYLWLFLRLWLRTLLPHYKDPNLLFLSLCCSRVPCVCTGWVSIGCQFRSSSLAWQQVQVQPKKGEEGKQRDLSFYSLYLFLEYCSVPTLLCAKEEVRRSQVYEVTGMKRLQNRHCFEHRSHTQASAPGSENC